MFTDNAGGYVTVASFIHCVSYTIQMSQKSSNILIILCHQSNILRFKKTFTITIAQLFFSQFSEY